MAQARPRSIDPPGAPRGGRQAHDELNASLRLFVSFAVKSLAPRRTRRGETLNVSVARDDRPRRRDEFPQGPDQPEAKIARGERAARRDGQRNAVAPGNGQRAPAPAMQRKPATTSEP